jgi:hypothetical protein
MGWRPQMVLWYWCRYSVKAAGSRCGGSRTHDATTQTSDTNQCVAALSQNGWNGDQNSGISCVCFWTAML